MVANKLNMDTLTLNQINNRKSHVPAGGEHAQISSEVQAPPSTIPAVPTLKGKTPLQEVEAAIADEKARKLPNQLVMRKLFRRYVKLAHQGKAPVKPNVLKTGDSVVDALDLEDLLARPHLGYDIRHKRAYLARKAALSLLDAYLQTDIVLRRRNKALEVREQLAHYQSPAVFTESKTSITHSLRSAFGAQGKKSRVSKLRHRSISPEPPAQVLDCNCCQGVGDVTFDQFCYHHESRIFTESDTVGQMKVGGKANHSDTHENATDYVGEETEMVNDLGISLHRADVGSSTQFALNNFFERPVVIYHQRWYTNTPYNVALDVWDLWSKDASVRAKLNNYAYFKGTLHLKIAFSGSPYNYGKAMASYQPYAMYNDNLSTYDSALVNSIAGVEYVRHSYHNYLSQAPGVCYFDYKENKPTEIEIPFISHKNKFRLFDGLNSVITPTTSYDDFLEAGELRLVTLNVIKDTQETLNGFVPVVVYAWVSNIELSSITSTDVNITAESKEIFTEAKSGRRKRRMEEADDSSDDESETPQSTGKTHASLGQRVLDNIKRGVNDEYAQPGPISNVASAVANAGDALSSVPVIGDFAKATSTVARGIGKVATMFGWSRPVVLEDPVFVKNVPFQNGACTVGKETTFKISLDPKQELCVDQSLGGMMTDQMAIKEIAARETYLCTMEWADTNLELNHTIFKSLVTPMLYTPGTAELFGGVFNRVHQPTAMEFAATPFQSWRGRVRFRFEINCSQFHRGKLIFTYDPNFAQHVLISSHDSKLNQQNSVILDIQEAQDITFDIDWAYPRSWAAVGEAYKNHPGSWTNFGDDGPAISDFSNWRDKDVNGFIEVRPFNNLVQPTATSPVSINVYVSCPDLEVNRLSEENIPTSRDIYTQSKDVTVTSLNKTGEVVTDKIFLDHYGERIASFRSLLKRYVTTDSASVTFGGTKLAQFRAGATMYPVNILPVGEPSPNYAFKRDNLFSYLKPAFMGVRGGYRHRLCFTSSGQEVGYTRASMDVSSGTLQPLDLTLTKLEPGNHLDFTGNQRAKLSGSLTFHQATNGGIEFEIPFYSRNLFNFAFANDYAFNTVLDDDLGYDKDFGSNYFTVVKTLLGTSGDTVYVQQDTASAEDFSFFRFQGAPFWTFVIP